MHDVPRDAEPATSHSRGGRFLVVGRLDPRSGGPLGGWPGRQVPNLSSAVPAGEPWYAWLLLSANNRDLGRSTERFATYELCTAAALRLQREPDAVGTVVAEGAPGSHGWRVTTGDVPVAVSSRVYLREREARYSLRRFTEAIASAHLHDGVRQLDGRRRLLPHTLLALVTPSMVTPSLAVHVAD